MTALALASVAFNRPRLIAEQIRLLRKYLKDEFTYSVVDNSSSDVKAEEIANVCAEAGVPYHRVEFYQHVPALQFLWDEVLWPTDATHLGVLDHDVYPTKPVSVIPRIDDAGFAGIGQRHGPTGHQYLWPGFCFFRRDFVGDRPVSWDGIRGKDKADDGDTGSAMWPLFSADSWKTMYRGGHTYEAIRQPDNFGSQSWAVERFWDSSWLHFSNGSDWLAVPNPREREALLWAMLEAL